LRLVFGVSIVILFPLSVQANIFSFVSDLFNNSVDIIDKTATNSQNMALLEASLGVDPNLAKGGGEIVIVENTALLSETGPSGTVLDIKDQVASDQISIYVVRKGDSLSQIAKMFNVSVNTIIWANDLHKSTIKEGQTLVILPISGVRHTVVAGETLASIAKKYKGDLDEISQFNNIDSKASLAVGDVVVVPDGEMNSYSYGTTSSAVVKGAGGPSYSSGYYLKPVNGRKSQGLHGYNAVDIAASTGTPIFASASGQVILSKNSGWNGGYGNYVVIKHNNGTQTLYAHMSQDIVYVGQGVVQGQVIGYVGSTGKSTGPHIHFEVRGAKNPF